MNSLYFLIPTFLIIIFMIPVLLEAKFTFNLEDLSGVFCIYVFGIKIQYYIYKVQGTSVILKNKKETKVKHVEFDSKEILFVEFLMKEIKDKIRLKELFVNYNIGMGDAFLSSMVCGGINSILFILFTGIKNKKPTASLGVYDTISYNREVFEVAVKGKVSISIFDIVYSLIMSVILSKRAINKKTNNI